MWYNSPKKSPRGSVKNSVAIPYTSSSPFWADVKKRRSAQRPKVMSLLSRAASAVVDTIRSRSHSPPLQYGDILRDVPFHTHNRVVSFFSTHHSFCEDKFNVRHGECVRFLNGPWVNEVAVVLGVRGGVLWVVGSDCPVTARPVVATDGRQQWEKAMGVHSELLRRFHEGLEAARRDAHLDYDAEQRDFLQRAPDLYAEVVDDDEEDFGGGVFDVGEVLKKRQRYSTGASWRCSEDRASFHHENDASTNTKSRSSTSTKSHQEERYNNHNNHNFLTTKEKRVILVPQVVQVTGDLGWAGEGMVLVNGGGVRCFAASLSASLLL